jgi:hypothetical protein
MGRIRPFCLACLAHLLYPALEAFVSVLLTLPGALQHPYLRREIKRHLQLAYLSGVLCLSHNVKDGWLPIRGDSRQMRKTTLIEATAKSLHLKANLRV